MAKTYNVSIPPTLLRLGATDVEDLILTGLNNDITRDDISRLLDARYPNRRKAARAILRIVTDSDIDTFNWRMEDLRNSGIHDGMRMALHTTYHRGISTIRILGE